MKFYDNQQISNYYNLDSNHGRYQYQTLDELVNTFMIIYVGENKIIPKADKNDVYFFGRRALQEMNYDILRSKKTWEFELDNRMYIPLPHDFVNHTHVFRVDQNGIKQPLYPTRDTQNPFRPKPKIALGEKSTEKQIRAQYDKYGSQYPGSFDDWWETSGVGNEADITYEKILTGYEKDAKGREDRTKPIYESRPIVNYPETYTGIVHDNTADSEEINSTSDGVYYTTNADGERVAVTDVSSATLSAFASTASNSRDNSDSADDSNVHLNALGQRYGIDPVRSQNNGSYYFDYANGRIYFGPALIGETLVLDYITDGLGDGGDSVIHKFAEEAWYKHVAYAMASTGSNYSPATVQMLKKERFAETRKAKLRLSNLKSQEMEQVMRGKSKWIKR